MMKLNIEPSISSWDDLCIRPYGHDGQQENIVSTILHSVKSKGDIALQQYTENFDQVKLTVFEVTADEINVAVHTIDQSLKESILLAKANIEKFHQAQRTEQIKIETMPGVICWQKSVAIEKVGIYVPGGTAPLFSTVLMLAVPARIAGCKEIILCTPPDKNGQINQVILYVAHICGVTKIFKVGGAQAIAAMAYGTKSIPKVNKIFGPGNSYVTMAKMKVQQEGMAIDMPAGPSEVLILADESADAEWVAIDLLSQAEHGVDSQVILVANDVAIIQAVQTALKKLMKELPRAHFAQGALDKSHAIVLKEQAAQIEFINRYAPEHLILNHIDADTIAEMILNAGSIFIGPYSPESVGDYASGTNHTLPTSSFAKSYSGVNLDSFIKKITYQKLSAEGLKIIGPHVERMAEAEQLKAHKLAVTKRLQKLNAK